MDKLEVVNEWIKYSNRDFDTAEHLLNNMFPAPLEIICYLSQQSAEKALKAFWINMNIDPPKTHDLTLLNNTCIKYDKLFIELMDICTRLTHYSSQPRYPLEMEITIEKAKLAIKDAKIITSFIKKKLTL